MTNTTIRRRDPRGRPTGGQFAEEAMGASGIGLSPTEDPWSDRLGKPSGFELSAVDLAHLQDLVARAKRSSRFIHATESVGRSWDAEDLTQDTMLALMERARARGSVTEVSPALARSVMRNTMSRALNSHNRGMGAENHKKVNSADLGAWREFAIRVDELETAADRMLTPAERDEVAAQIRTDWHDPKHRPTQDFHRHRFDTGLESEGADLGHARAVSAEDDYLQAIHQGPDTERVLSMPKQGGAMRPYAWNAICELRGIPKQPQGVLNNNQITRCKQAIGATNQEVLSAVEEWESGLSNERTEALFRPFGAASQSHRAQIAEVVRDMPDRGGHVYSLALAGATGRNFKKQENTS